MKIGTILITIVTALSMLVTGCAGTGSQVTTPTTGSQVTTPATGTLQVMVTDAPPKEEVTSIMVTIESVTVHKAVAEQEQQQSSDNATEGTTDNTTDESGWLPLDILAGKETFDLLKVKGIEEVLAVTELEAGKYTQIRMTITSVQVKLGDGELQEATLPSGKLKFTHPFDVVAGETTALLFDFDAEKSVNVTGSDRITVKPVVKLSTSKPQTKPITGNVKITTSSLPDGTANITYNATLAASGGTPPYTWSIDSGILPAGLILDSDNGSIAGIPAGSGNSTLTMKVSDNSIPVKSDTREYTIAIAASGT
ncbi:MAG: DUF4382 domain-containing protein [Dehalococcoidales bacterium]|nr:DUF4382 domain-containing protein [Dehalococcoidales bacterium]